MVCWLFVCFFFCENGVETKHWVIVWGMLASIGHDGFRIQKKHQTSMMKIWHAGMPKFTGKIIKSPFLNVWLHLRDISNVPYILVMKT